MSKISQLTQQLQKQSQELQTNTEAELLSEFKKHKDFIKSNLSEQQNVIKSYTDELTEQAKRHTAKTLEQAREAQQNLIEGLDQNTTKLIEQIKRTQKIQTEQTQRVWTVTAIVMMIITGIVGIVLLILIYLASEEASKLQRWAKSAEYWESQSENIMLSKCEIENGVSRYCVQIDPKYKGMYWGEKGNLMILAPVK